MATRFYRYLTDNPFRLLGVGSATSYQELAKRSRSATHAAKVGLASPPALAELLGDDELVNCASVVRSLANDPLRLTLYRLFWPLTLPSAEEYQSLTDLGCRDGWPEETLPPEEWQREFACEWCRFQLNLNRQGLELVYACYEGAFSQPGLDGVLIDLLTGDGFSQERAEGVVSGAAEEVARWLLSTVVRYAAEAVANGNLVDAVDLLEILLQVAPFEGEKDEHLQLLRRCAEILVEQVQKRTQAFHHWEPECGVELPLEVRLLQQISVLFNLFAEDEERSRLERVTAAYVARCGQLIREYALERVDQDGDYRAASQALLLAAELPLEDQIARLVQHDLRRFQAILRVEERRAQAGQNFASTPQPAPDQQAASHRNASGEPARAQEPETPNRRGPNGNAAQAAAPGAPTRRRRPASELGTIQAARQGGVEQNVFSERQPITEAPILSTWNGIGTMMYGQTLFFVVFFIPLLPLAHYEVTGDGLRYQFTAHLPFQRWHKIWLAVVGIACVLGLSYYYWPKPDLSTVSSTVPIESTAAPVSSTPASSDPASSDPETGTRGKETGDSEPIRTTDTEALEQRRVRLEAERAKVQASVAELQTALQQSEEEQKRDSAVLDRAQADLAVAADELDRDRARLRELAATVDTDRQLLDRTDEAAVAAFNVQVDMLNQQQERFREQVRTYESDESEYKQSMLNHNVRLKSNRTRRRTEERQTRRLTEIEAALRELGQ